MAARKRTLTALAAGALLAPLSPFASPAYADHITPRTIDIACPEGRVSEGRYDDVPPDSGAFEREINCVSDYGIATGRQVDDFDREFNVTRRQMAQFVYREALLGGVQFDTTTDPGYSDDNDVTGEARDAIFGLTNAGVIQGVGGGRFNPNGDVRRDQMATFLVGLAELLELSGFDSTQDFFTDDETSVHEANINRIAGEGVTQGQGGDRIYGPFNPVLRQQMAAFLARVLDIAVEEGVIESIFPPATLTVNEEGEDVDAGDPITGTITGEGVESATVSGDCVEAGDVTDSDTAEGIQFSIPTDADADAGTCEITFTITFEGGGTQTETVSVNIAAVTGTNERPELVDAAIVSTTTAGQVTPTNPAGTVVSYTFDEDVLETGAPPRVGSFFIFDSAGNRLTANSIVDVDGDTVTVRFNTVDTAEEAAAITLATVDTNAVTDTDGDTNPEGDAELGTTTGGASTPLPAGQTDGPDLVSVGNFRQGASAGQTAVDFTFDEAAFITNSGGFALIEISEANGAANDNEERGAAQAAGTPATGTGSQPSGGTVAGGNGTTVITVIFNDDDSDAVLTAADIARGTVDANTVSDVQTGGATAGNQNPLQAADVSGGGNTPEPDLVSVELRPAATTGGQNSALFVFDQAVTTANAAGFFLYEVDGDEIGGTNARVNTSGDSRQVLVDFPTTVNVVGGNVRDNAVTAGMTATNLVADNNEQDEVGVAGTSGGTTGQTAGRTAGPDLTGVAISRQQADVFGNPGNFQATYTFDEDVTGEVENNFFLYLEDGTRLVATTCTTATAEDTDNTVTCTAFSTLSDTGTTAAATQAQIGSAVLGTVDDGAVQSRLTDNSGAQAGTATESGTNPEGAEPTSGATTA